MHCFIHKWPKFQSLISEGVPQLETYHFTMRNKQLNYKIECDRSDFKTMMGMEGEHPNTKWCIGSTTCGLITQGNCFLDAFVKQRPTIEKAMKQRVLRKK